MIILNFDIQTKIFLLFSKEIYFIEIFNINFTKFTTFNIFIFLIILIKYY